MLDYHAKFADRLFFDAVCAAAASDERPVPRRALLSLVDQRLRPISGGMWNTAEANRPNREALTMLADLLKQDAAPFLLSAFREELDRNVFHETRCRILFLLQEFSVWPATEYFYRTAAADERFDAQAVYVPFSHESAAGEDPSFEDYQAAGIPVRRCHEYDLARENPDVVVFTKPYDSIPKQFYISEVEKIAKYTIYVPYGLELNKSLLRYGFQDYTHYAAWRHLAYGGIVKAFGTRYGYRNGENIAVWGHPRVDSYHPRNKAAFHDSEWEARIAGRKVILWCPHHTIMPGPECVSTWLDNHEAILSFFAGRKDAVLLWRPHPLLFGAIVNNGIMTQPELNAFLAEVRKCENIILDQTSDYRTAFAMSDAIITDGTTFSIEYLLTGKPLMVTTRSLEAFYEPEEMEKALYIGKTHDDIRAFIENVLAGNDPRIEERLAYADRLFLRLPDKTVSENILDNILLDIRNEVQLQIKKATGA